MNRPNFVNLDRLKKRVRNLNKPNMTMTAQELKAVDADIDALLQYTIDLQSQIIELKDQQGGQSSTEIHMDGGDFFGNK